MSIPGSVRHATLEAYDYAEGSPGRERPVVLYQRSVELVTA